MNLFSRSQSEPAMLLIVVVGLAVEILVRIRGSTWLRESAISFWGGVDNDDE